MANNFQLRRVVAFDQTNEPVRAPLDSWRVSYDSKRKTIKLAVGDYGKSYDLRTSVLALTLDGERKKLAIGKTLGKLALSGIAGGKSGAFWDLRITGLSKDSVGQFSIIFKDTSMVSFEVDANDIEEFSEPISSDAISDDAKANARALVNRIKQMAEDGERVMAELNAELSEIQNDISAAKELVDVGRSFDERSAAKARLNDLEATLESKTYQRNALDYATRKTNSNSVSTETKPRIETPKQIVEEIRISEEIVPDTVEPVPMSIPGFDSLKVDAIATTPLATTEDKRDLSLKPPIQLVETQAFSISRFLLKSVGLIIGALIGLTSAVFLQTSLRVAFVCLVIGGAAGLMYVKKKLR